MSILISKFRRLKYNFKSKKLWHMRHYASDFKLSWSNPLYDINNKRLTKLDRLQFDHIWLNKNRFVRLNSLAMHQNLNTIKLAVLASGPSLKLLNHETIKSHDLAFLNGSIKLIHKFETYSSKKYHFVSDPNFIQNNLDIYDDNNLNSIYFIYAVRAFYELWTHRPNFVLKNLSRFQIFDQIQEPFSKPKPTIDDLLKLSSDSFKTGTSIEVGFSLDPKLGFFCGRTILIPCLQIATFWGYKKVEIYGADMQGQKRFYDGDLKNRAPSYLDQDFESVIMPSLKILAQEMKSRDISVKNLSPTSRIPSNIFEKHEFCIQKRNINNIEYC